MLDADALDETVRITLPGGFRLDETPDPVHLYSAFGKHDATWTPEGGVLAFRRKLEVQAQTVPVARYKELQKFLDTVYGSAELPVVLVK